MDDLTLTVNGQDLSGWTEIELTRSCEAIPPTFSIGLSAKGPAGVADVPALAGNTCSVLLGTDPVLAGYIDRDINGGDAESHTLQIVGRGATCDLVDCSAEWPHGQIVGANVLEVAQKLCDPYGLKVITPPGTPLGDPIPQIALNYGETAAGLIERFARAAGLLFYEAPDSSLVLARVGASKAASGLVYGENVQSWSVTHAMDQRYSRYACEAFGTFALLDVTGPGAGGDDTTYFVATDPDVTRHRQLYLVCETVDGQDKQALCKQVALWEAQRRAGRGLSVVVTIDSWRDADGKLWEPNSLVQVDLPGLDPPQQQLCISTVTYRRGHPGGTTADLLLMPPKAFTLEPINLQPTNLGGVTPGPGQGGR